MIGNRSNLRTYGSISLFVVALTILGLYLRFWIMNEGSIAYKDDHGSVAINWLLPLAYLGDSRAQWLVGCAFEHQLDPSEENRKNANYWFNRAGKLPSSLNGSLVADESRVKFFKRECGEL